MISRAYRTALSIGALSWAGVAAAQAPESDTAPSPDTEDAAAETCFSIGRARDINVISDRHIYVQTIGRNHYLLTMAGSCDNLERSYRSGDARIQPYGRRVCANDGSHVVYRWFGRESVCPILTIDPVADRAEALALAESGRIPVEAEEVELPE